MASRIALAALALMTAGLAACAHEKVALDGYRWAYMADGSDVPRLAYGRPNTDDVVLMISCRPGQDQVDVSALGLSGAEIVLTSGRAESRFPADALEDEVSGGKLLEGRGRTSAPALTNFRKSGELDLMVQGGRHSLTAISADQGQVKAFFKACGA